MSNTSVVYYVGDWGNNLLATQPDFAELATRYYEYKCEPPEVTYLLCTFVEEFSVCIVS